MVSPQSQGRSNILVDSQDAVRRALCLRVLIEYGQIAEFVVAGSTAGSEVAEALRQNLVWIDMTCQTIRNSLESGDLWNSLSHREAELLSVSVSKWMNQDVINVHWRRQV